MHVCCILLTYKHITDSERWTGLDCAVFYIPTNTV